MTYRGVISPYQIICPHPQGLPIGPAPPQVEQVEEEEQDKCKEDRHREDEGLVQLELRRFGRAVVWRIWGGARHHEPTITYRKISNTIYLYFSPTGLKQLAKPCLS